MSDISEPTGPCRVVIADDEALACRRLQALLAECQRDFPHLLVGEAATGEAALRVAAEQGADIALLDVHMPGMDGLAAARQMARLPSPPAVIFLTAHDQHAVEAFEIGALDYLLKPVRLERLKLALQRARRLTPEQDRQLQSRTGPRAQLVVTDRGRVLLVPVAEVLFLRADEKYVVAQTVERSYLLSESLASLEEEFGPRFLRIHRGCLVSRQHLAGFEPAAGEGGHWQAVVRGWAERLPVSRRQAHVVRLIRNE